MGVTIEMAGRQFGRWLVLEEAYLSPSGWHWLCECECGTKRAVVGSSLRRGTSTQCSSCANRHRRLTRARPEDLTGRRIGRWTVEKFGEIRDGRTYWLCRCACGRQFMVQHQSLLGGTSTRCRPCVYERSTRPLQPGQKVGDWTVLRKSHRSGNQSWYWHWLCRCDCGTVKPVSGSALRAGRTQRCQQCAYKKRRKVKTDDAEQ